MVIKLNPKRRERGFLVVDMCVAIGLLTIAILPLAYSATRDARIFRATYQKAIAMEIVDGELEILAVGAGQNIAEGKSIYAVKAAAVTNLPPGNFVVTREGKKLRLEWSPQKKCGVAPVSREVLLR